MEQLKGPTIEDGDQWSSPNNGTFTGDEEATFMTQLFNSTNPDPFMAALDNLHEEAPYERPSSSSLYRLSQETSEFSGGSYCSQLLFPTYQNDHNYCNNLMNFCLGDQLGNNNNGGGFNLEDEDSMNLEMSESNLQACSEAELIKLPEEEAAMEEEGHNQLEINCKKRSRGSGDVQKKRNERSKKTQKLTLSSIPDEDGNAGHSKQSTSSYCSEDESNTSLELNGGANNLGSSPQGPTKSRASRCSATDPQNLYARRRRERINERLKILQNLVPNGTKVDISTMLEEAVQYVKFLQLQIKLLSSDDLWMYAPIAYNGMDIGLNPTPNTPKES